MLATVRKWLRRRDAELDAPFLAECVRQLESDVQQLQQSELTRAAEHAMAVDKLERLFKRISARVSRDPAYRDLAERTDESPLALRERIRGR